MKNNPNKLDRMDCSILNELMKNSRITMIELGQKIGLSKTPTTTRVKRLEAKGIITGYHVGLSATQLGLEHIAFVEVRLSDTHEKALREFNEAVRNIPEVEECHMIAGGFDYLVKIRTQDIQAYRKLLGEKLSTLPHFGTSSTYVSMESVKDRGVDQF